MDTKLRQTSLFSCMVIVSTLYLSSSYHLSSTLPSISRKSQTTNLPLRSSSLFGEPLQAFKRPSSSFMSLKAANSLESNPKPKGLVKRVISFFASTIGKIIDFLLSLLGMKKNKPLTPIKEVEIKQVEVKPSPVVAPSTPKPVDSTADRVLSPNEIEGARKITEQKLKEIETWEKTTLQKQVAAPVASDTAADKVKERIETEAAAAVEKAKEKIKAPTMPATSNVVEKTEEKVEVVAQLVVASAAVKTDKEVPAPVESKPLPAVQEAAKPVTTVTAKSEIDPATSVKIAIFEKNPLPLASSLKADPVVVKAATIMASIAEKANDTVIAPAASAEKAQEKVQAKASPVLDKAKVVAPAVSSISSTAEKVIEKVAVTPAPAPIIESTRGKGFAPVASTVSNVTDKPKEKVVVEATAKPVVAMAEAKSEMDPATAVKLTIIEKNPLPPASTLPPSPVRSSSKADPVVVETSASAKIAAVFVENVKATVEAPVESAEKVEAVVKPVVAKDETDPATAVKLMFYDKNPLPPASSSSIASSPLKAESAEEKAAPIKVATPAAIEANPIFVQASVKVESSELNLQAETGPVDVYSTMEGMSIQDSFVSLFSYPIEAVSAVTAPAAFEKVESSESESYMKPETGPVDMYSTMEGMSQGPLLEGLSISLPLPAAMNIDMSSDESADPSYLKPETGPVDVYSTMEGANEGPLFSEFSMTLPMPILSSDASSDPFYLKPETGPVDLYSTMGGMIIQSPLSLKDKIKSAGISGTIAYIITEIGFWAANVPLILATSLSDGDQTQTLLVGAGILTLARFAVPFRLAVALDLTPIVEENITKRYLLQNATNKRNLAEFSKMMAVLLGIVGGNDLSSI
jgi:hypothetical protein